LQARIRTLEEQERTLLEKRNRLADVRWEVRNVLGILEDAAGYGRWDAGRGSLLSSFLKQERVQKAKEAMIGLQEAVQRAKDVEDKQLSAAQDHLQEARRQRGWDIFLDNILIDWSVQDEIEMALARLHHFSGARNRKFCRNSGRTVWHSCKSGGFIWNSIGRNCNSKYIAKQLWNGNRMHSVNNGVS